MNVADDFLKGFNAQQNNVDRVRRRGIEDRSMQMREQDFNSRQGIMTQRSQINEMQIEDHQRGQLKQQADDDFRILQQTGQLPAPETYQRFKEAGMPEFSPYHYADQANVKSVLDLKPVVQAIAQGNPEGVNTPDNLARLNAAYKSQIQMGIGEHKPELGGNIVDKQISRFEVLPESGGKIAVRLKATLDNGMTYEEPMTVGRDANPNAPVKALDAKTLMDDVMVRYQIGKFYSTPQGQQITRSMLDVLNPGQRQPDLSQIYQALPEQHRQSFSALASADPKRAMAFASSVMKPDNSLVTINNEADKAGMTEEQKALAKSRVKRFETINTAAQSALDQNEHLSQLASMDVTSGLGEGGKVQLARVFNAFGANGDELLGVDAANTQAFNAVSGKLLAEALAAQKGPQTDKDASRIAETLPRIANEGQANKYILTAMHAINDRKVEQAQFYEKILESDGTLKDADKKWREFKRNTPLSSATIVNKQTKLPMFYFQFVELAKQANPQATDDQILDAWRNAND